jgi:hypothetical protein
MGVVLQEPERDKYAFQSEAHVDCENRVHLCEAACQRRLNPNPLYSMSPVEC